MRNNRVYELQFEIENSCLLDCVHCSSFEMRKTGKRSYSDDEIIDFISFFSGPLRIYLTGGDPILYPNLINLCQRIVGSKKDVSIGLYTTGNCVQMQPISKELSICLAQAGISDCYFSIYSNIPEEHDAFTKRTGSFRNVLSSVENLCLTKIQPKAHLVLTKQNYEKIDSIISFCSKVGFVEVRILKLAPSGNAWYNWDKIGVPEEIQDEIIASLIRRREDFVTRLSFSGYPHLHPCRASKDAIRCQAGTNLAYITLSGDVYPCASTISFADRYKLGNVANPAKVWNNLLSAYPNLYNEYCLNSVRRDN